MVTTKIFGESTVSKIIRLVESADKVEYVEQLLSEKPEGKILAFVGDGINDAPVLKRADVGIAMGGLGSDAAIETADVALIDDNPSKIATAIVIARSTIRIARENVVFAIGVKVAVLLLATVGLGVNEEYLCSIKAYDGTQETSINLLKLTSNNMLLDGLTYIATYSVNDFKELSNCSHVYIKKDIETNQLFFTYGTNIGAVAINSIPKEPMFSIVSNSNGKIFVLLTEKCDVGKTSFPPSSIEINDDSNKKRKETGFKLS